MKIIFKMKEIFIKDGYKNVLRVLCVMDCV